MRLVVVETDGLGGLAHFAYQLCNALADEGADVTLLTSRHYELAHLPHRFRLEPSLPMWPNVSPEPTWVARLPRSARALRHRGRRAVRAAKLAGVWARLTTYLIREAPDAVQFSLVRFPFQALFLHRLRRAGLTLTQVCHEHEPRETSAVSRALTRSLSGPVFRAFSVIFFLGAQIRMEFLERFEIDPARTRVIDLGNGSLFVEAGPSAGDLRERYGLPAEAPVALFFGGLRPSKGIEDLITAFARVVNELPAARLLIVGTPMAGVNPDDYVQRAQAAGIGHAVTIDPRYVPLDEVSLVARTGTAAVLPYRSGTTSASLQVAYAFGRPVIVTNVGSVAEAVIDGRTGFVVPPGDLDALARAMVAVLRDPSLARSMGATGRQLAAERHAWPAIARKVLAATAAAMPRQSGVAANCREPASRSDPRTSDGGCA